jgi:hypothetical protein
MNLSSVRRYTIIEHGLQIVSGYCNMGVRGRKSSCFALFCFVVVVVVVVLSRVFKVPFRALQRVSKSQLQKDSSLVGGLAKAVVALFLSCPTTQQPADIHHLTPNLESSPSRP